MNIGEIRHIQTELKCEDQAPTRRNVIHESVFRAYHIIDYIKQFLVANPKIKDTTILLELITFMEE